MVFESFTAIFDNLKVIWDNFSVILDKFHVFFNWVKFYLIIQKQQWTWQEMLVGYRKEVPWVH